MFTKKRRGYVRKGRGRKVAFKKQKQKGISLAVKKYVNRTIHKTIENKQTALAGAFDFGSVSQNPSLNVYPMLPYAGYGSMPQGVTQGSRTGNSITVRKLMLNYVLRPNPYSVSTNAVPMPVEIMLFLGNLRQEKGVLPISTDFAQLFQLGGTSVAPTGSLVDLLKPINEDFWHISKKWSHKIGYANQSSVPNTSNFNFTNNDFKLNVVRKMNITKLVPKILKFDDSGSTVRGNNLFFFFQSINSDGTVSGATSTPAHIDFYLSLEYEDA